MLFSVWSVGVFLGLWFVSRGGFRGCFPRFVVVFLWVFGVCRVGGLVCGIHAVKTWRPRLGGAFLAPMACACGDVWMGVVQARGDAWYWVWLDRLSDGRWFLGVWGSLGSLVCLCLCLCWVACFVGESFLLPVSPSSLGLSVSCFFFSPGPSFPGFGSGSGLVSLLAMVVGFSFLVG